VGSSAASDDVRVRNALKCAGLARDDPHDDRARSETTEAREEE
jgi:hypothetical protein